MKTTSVTIKPQGEPKSVLDMTHFELSQIDAYQNKNRIFSQEDEADYSDGIGHDTDYFWED